MTPLLAFPFVCLLAAQCLSDLPQLVLEEGDSPAKATFNAPVSKLGQEIQFEFSVVNNRKESLDIDAAKVSCDCLKLKSSNRKIDSFASEKITATFRTSRSVETKTLGISLLNSDKNEVGMVRVVVETKRLVDLSPLDGFKVDGDRDEDLRFSISSSFLSSEQLNELHPTLECEGFLKNVDRLEGGKLVLHFDSESLTAGENPTVAGNLCFADGVGVVVETIPVEFSIRQRIRLTPAVPFLKRSGRNWATKFIVTGSFEGADGFAVHVQEEQSTVQGGASIRKLTAGSYLVKVNWESGNSPSMIKLDLDGRKFDIEKFIISGD